MAVGSFAATIAVPLVFAWLYRMAAREPAVHRENAYVFGAPKALTSLLLICGLLFAAGAGWSGYAAITSPSSEHPIWAPIVFVAFVLLIPFSLPGTLQTDESGVTRVIWYRRTLRLAWRDVERIDFNAQSGSVVVVARGGRKIQHVGGCYVGTGMFLREVLSYTRLPLTLLTPGVWKVKKTEVPNERALALYASD